MKICLVASRGGHLQELQFAKFLDSKNEFFLITEGISSVDVSNEHIYYVPPVNRRETLAVYKVIRLFIQANHILKKEKPDCFISTGALISIPVLILGKLRRKKIVFIETFARVESGSISGRIAYHFADLFLIYWKKLLAVYPNAVYINPFEEDRYDIGLCGNTEIPV